MTDNRTILTAIVGSRLHGTATDASDTDLRGVFVAPLMDILSPFRTPRETEWLEGDVDNTSYELRKFCKLCAQGNPTALEVLVGQVQHITPEGEELRALLPAFLSRKCAAAFLGYAKNQEKKFRENFQDRKWKYAAAEVRTLYQLLHLLQTGNLRGTYEPEEVTFLKSIRAGQKTDAEVMAEVFRLEEACKQALAKTSLAEEADIGRIEEFLIRAYQL